MGFIETLLSIGGVAVVVIVGIFYVIGLFKRNKDKEDDRLINILQGTVDELEKKVNKQALDIEKLTREVHELRFENQKYIEIFQGRDAKMQEYFTKGLEAMEVVGKTHEIVSSIADGINTSNKNMSEFMKLMGRHMDIISSKKE